MSETHLTADPFKRHTTRHRGITYRLRADGSRSYAVYCRNRQHPVEGGEREALAKQAELRGKIARGEQVAAANVKFGVMAEEWLASKVKLREKTRADHRRALDLVLVPAFGHLKLAQVTPDRIAALIRGLEREGLHHVDRSRPVRPLGASQVKNYVLKPLNGTFKLAQRRGLVGSNPVSVLSSDERPHEAETERPYEWSPQTIKAVIEAARTRGHSALLIETGFASGFRIGELTGLQWRDIDFDARLIHARRQFTNGAPASYVKTEAGYRDVPVSSELIHKLRAHRVASRFSQEEDIVFCSRKGTHLNPGNVRSRGWYPALAISGTPKLRFHNVRDAYASTLIAAGLPVTAVASVLGHSDPAITLRIYSHLFNRQGTHEAVREAMRVVLA